MRVLILRLASLAALGVVLCCGWFATLELVLRRPDYGWRFLVAAALVVEGALTLAVIENLIDLPALRSPLSVGAAATALLGVWLIADDLSRPGLPAAHHFEGYLLLIGLALLGYGVMTVLAMGVRRGQTPSDPVWHRPKIAR